MDIHLNSVNHQPPLRIFITCLVRLRCHPMLGGKLVNSVTSLSPSYPSDFSSLIFYLWSSRAEKWSWFIHIKPIDIFWIRCRGGFWMTPHSCEGLWPVNCLKALSSTSLWGILNLFKIFLNPSTLWMKILFSVFMELVYSLPNMCLLH